MSIILGKRVFGETEFKTDIQTLDKLKRIRQSNQSQFQNNDILSFSFDNPIQKLKIIFPNMEEKTIQDVLNECENNIEKAMESLNRLSINDNSGGQDDKMIDSDAQINTKIHKYKMKPRVIHNSNTNNNNEEQLENSKDYAFALVKHLKNVKSEEEAVQLAESAFKSYEEKLNKKHISLGINNDLKENLKNLIKDNTTLKRAFYILNNKYEVYILSNNPQNISKVEQENEELKRQLLLYEDAYRKEKNANLQLQLFLKNDSCWKNDFIKDNNNPDVC